MWRFRLLCVFLCLNLVNGQFGFFRPNDREEKQFSFFNYLPETLKSIPGRITSIISPTTEATLEEQKEPEETKEVPYDEVNEGATPDVAERHLVPEQDRPLPALTPVPQSSDDVNFKGFSREPCTTADGNLGNCKTITDCPEIRNLLKSARSDPTVTDMLRKAHCGFEGRNPKVCCPRVVTSPPPTFRPPPIPLTEAPPAPVPQAPPLTFRPAPIPITEAPPSPAPVTQAPPHPLTESPPVNNTEPIPTPEDGLFEPPICGSNKAAFTRIVNGVPAKLGAFPWMAVLGYHSRFFNTPDWRCGGSLVTAKHVITAAHCIHNLEKDLYVVRLGELDLSRDDDGATPIDVPIQSLLKHEGYSTKPIQNDIGILLLSQAVVFTDLIRPICIPKTAELLSKTYENYNPLLAGWGDIKFRDAPATHLQMTQLPVVSKKECAQAYHQYTKQAAIDDRVLCAGFKRGGTDSCQGDSGGPLMQPMFNRETFKSFFYQIGVISFGKKCAEPGFPGVYSRVTHFVPWIQKTILENS